MQRLFKNKKWLFIGIAGLLIVAILIAVLNGARSARLANQPLSAVAEPGTITSTVIGSGSLQFGENRELLLPVNLKVVQVNVAAGDYIEPGDVLATFEPASVQTQIEALQDEMETVDNDINYKKGATVSTYVYANISGRVKELYAQEGLETANVVADHGALMVLSIDGYMGVDFDAPTGLKVGDSVTVQLADGTTKTGTIERIKDAVATAIISDNGPKTGESVTVLRDDKKIGAGNLYIHQPISVLGSSGKIRSVNVSMDSWVSVGNTVVSLEDVSFSAEYQELLAKHDQIAAALANLIAISRTNSLVSTFSGVIQSVNITNGSKTSKTSGSASDAMTGGGNVDLSSLLNNMSSSGDEASIGFLGAARPDESSIQLLGAGGPITDIDNTMVKTGLSSLVPVKGAAPVTTVSATEFNGTVTWMTTDATFAGGTTYNALITITANTGFKFPIGFTPDLGDGITVSNVNMIGGDNEGNQLVFLATYPETAADNTPDPTLPDIDLDALLGGLNGLNSLNGLGSFDISSLYSGATGTATTSSDYQMTGFSVAAGDNMSLVIEIDQLDIGAVKKGQAASVSFDAIPGKTFEGVITKISDSASGGSSGSSVARYKVSISLARDAAMRAAMNATATITVNEKTNILCLPVDAIQESGARLFVYTHASDKGVLSGEIDVTTGVSDGKLVEILSGITSGDTVFYQENLPESFEERMARQLANM